jgi:diguanylate cyclase
MLSATRQRRFPIRLRRENAMPVCIADLVFFSTTAVSGAAAAAWWCKSHVHRRTAEQGGTQPHLATDVLTCLHDMVTCVAVDVNDHGSQIKVLNDTLTKGDAGDAAMIVDVVAKLIRTNQQMQEKLNATEDKLRTQAQQIQTHATEARTDALTLLANRRVFDSELARCVADYRRLRRTFSLIMVDIDWFKKCNDVHGHQTGDAVLREVARLLRRKMRDLDIATRYGGEEFAILLPGMNLDHAAKAAVQLCGAVDNSSFRHRENEVRVTVSVGVAEVQGDEDGMMLVARADKALLSAKEGGRNCVYRHDGGKIQRVVCDDEPVATPVHGQQPSVAKRGELEQATSAPDAATAEPKSDRPQAAEPDALAGLASRTTLCQQIRTRMAEWKRGGPTFCVVLVEIGQFDHHGEQCRRQVREAAILAATKVFAATVREMDVVGQYAPGCFGLLLPAAGLVDAIQVAKRLREEFAQYGLQVPDERARPTLSMGMVQAMEKDDTISLLKRAEAALDATDRRQGNQSCYDDGKRCVLLPSDPLAPAARMSVSRHERRPH